MLVLSRRIGERLRIGDDITVTILQIRGNQVSIGIQADKSISVHREEIYRRIKSEQEQEQEQEGEGEGINVVAMNGVS